MKNHNDVVISEEIQHALNKYQSIHDLESQEETIEKLLPEWALNPYISQELGLLIEMTKKSRHYTIDESQISEEI